MWWPAGKAAGYIEAIDKGRAAVVFDDGKRMQFALSANALERAPFEPGVLVMRRSDQAVGFVAAPVPGGSVPTWSVIFPTGQTNVPEWTLVPAPLDDPVERMKSGNTDPPDAFNLRCVAADLWLRHMHDELVSLAHARVDLKPHQVSVVHRVISSYPHRFLLSDEVGLGKTIEAAMVIKELRARGIAKRVLILVPPGLVRQWQFELKTKFNEIFAIYNRETLAYLRNQGVDDPWGREDSIIASDSWASWEEARRNEIAGGNWDLVIVDEAHHARRQRNGNRVTMTNLYRLIFALTSAPGAARRAVLFLTATPMQLQTHELYSLVEMLNPTLFSSEDDFSYHLQERAGLNRLVEIVQAGRLPEGDDLDELLEGVAAVLEVDKEEANRRLIAEPEVVAEELRAYHRLSEVLIRNRRAVVGGFQPRHAFRWEVQLSPREIEIQKRMDEVLSEGYEAAAKQRRNATGFLMVIWQKLLASSSRALLRSLESRVERLRSATAGMDIRERDAEEQLADDETATSVSSRVAPALADEVRKLQAIVQLLLSLEHDSKADVLIANLKDLFEDDRNAKVLLFTEFRETQDYLAERIRGQGWGCNLFHGQLTPIEKDDAVGRFHDGEGPQVLISTEAGGEGRNFQFAHILVNYDLPWNPMRVEQRIGRVDRIGQEHPVQVFNFHVKGTIEGRILEVLEQRIRLFEESVGGLDPILGEAEADIRKAMQRRPEERDEALEKVGKRLEAEVAQARRASEMLRDLVLDSRSYSAEIAQTVLQQRASVTQEEFEAMLVRLLKSANTYVELNPGGSEHTVHFHPPFTTEQPQLIGTTERRRVCFDPRVSPDSEHIEYLGFGHPIVDALVTRTIREKAHGAASARCVSPSDLPTVQPGWQFVWTVKVAAVESHEEVFSVFVGDDRSVDLDMGRDLLSLSRRFNDERLVSDVDLTAVDEAHSIARDAFTEYRDALAAKMQAQAQSRYDVERERIERLFRHRDAAAKDKLDASRSTLDRVSASSDPLQRQVVPIWEANVMRAEAELKALAADRQRMLEELDRGRMAQVEDRLLAMARIVPAAVPSWT
ncbi:MAG: DEAD/DEAH box helicase family protein [Dehalococcoidia bacterium]|nr:DEAD/DEAH box helicase family protein [Dehalococcoidia bacterium]